MLDPGSLLDHWGYLAIFLIVVLGNVGVPVPEETTLILAGYLVWRGELRGLIVVAVAIISAVAGDNMGYWIGRRHGGAVLDRLRRLTQVSPGRFERMRGFIIRYGPLAVFLARFIAGLRFLAGPLAGAIGIRARPFMMGNVLGAMVFVPLAVGAGYGVGLGFGEYLENALGEVENLVLIGAILMIGIVLLFRLRRAFRAPAES